MNNTDLHPAPSPCLRDRHGRDITYLRVSLTERCNFHCSYCCPDCFYTITEARPMQTIGQISRIISVAGSLGFNKVRLTGGEPLMREGIVDLVDEIRVCGYYRTIAMTTNGSLLTPRLAANLRTAGLTHLTVSLTTLDRDEFRRITGSDALQAVLKGIAAAAAQPFREIKVNMVVYEHTTKDQIDTMRNFCDSTGLTLQTIREFSLIDRDVSASTVIATDRPMHCDECNRIRLTAQGTLRPCLFDDTEVAVDFNHIADSIRKAVSLKPEKGSRCTRETLKTIGG